MIGTSTRNQPRRRARRFAILAIAGVVASMVPLSTFVEPGGAAPGDPCALPIVSAVACENTRPGTPTTDWQVSGSGDPTIQGFATSMSVNQGETVSFKILTPSSAYHYDILRLGYYDGLGARKVAAGLSPTANLPQSQPACATQASTGLIDCGNWAASASWAVPADAVSGVYLAHLVREDTGGGSLIPFVVRNDAGQSDVLLQTSDSTWQAYNTYGGNSLYSCTVACPPGNPQGYKAAYKVSYNRPFHTADDDQGRSWLLTTEWPMVRFMEANGYDVSYTSQIDTESRAPLLLNHDVFMSSGHDEYWSATQRANVEAARDAGVNLAFFTGNELFWKTRYEPSTAGPVTARRTLVTYKDSRFDAPVDPMAPAVTTGTWRDPRFSPPGDSGRPENALTGQYFIVNKGTTDIKVPYQYRQLRMWRNTSVANLASGQTKTLGLDLDTLGYEWDVDVDNGFRPPGLFRLSSTTVNVPEAFQDYGSTVAAETVTHNLVMYRAASGALVFGAGTVQWAFGLDTTGRGGTPDVDMQQATVNLLADMRAQPVTLIDGLTPASASSDTVAPTSTITAPAAGATLTDGATVTVSGTAADTGGGIVAGVEVSTDNGSTWHPATGTTSWTYSWKVHGNPGTTVKTRAVDDSGNREAPGTGRAVNINCPCSIFAPTNAPVISDGGDTNAIEVGMKFTTESFGTITGIRFYKSSANTGTHVGNLWSSSGQRLATATFTGETGSGWQQVNFAQPVPVLANTTYVASYFAPRGHYATDANYFHGPPSPPGATGNGVKDSPPLHASRHTTASPNGLYTYADSSEFPAVGDNGGNFWVDVSFMPSAAPGKATNLVATPGYSSAGLSWTAATTGGPATTYTITPYIGATAQPATVVSGSPAPTSAAITGLTNDVTYTFRVTASNPAGAAAPSDPSNAVQPSATASVVINGGFEGGTNPWVGSGVGTIARTNTRAHSGSWGMFLGTQQPAAQPLGDSSVTQTVTVPTGTSSLSFWYFPTSADSVCSGAACQWDWQEAEIRSTDGTTLAPIFKSNSNSQAWTNKTIDTTAFAGQTIVLWFNVHQDGASPPDDTNMVIDDVALLTNGAPAAPAAPTGVVATPDNGSASVSWTAPSNGGSPIASYTVTAFVGSTPSGSVTVSGEPPVTTADFPNLTPGTTYTFRVTATNAVGPSASSAPSNAVTPTALTAPAAPTAVTATAGNGAATVNWAAPASGGSPILSYTVTPFIVTETRTAQPPITFSGSPPATALTVNGLQNGTQYSFEVTATNAVGTSQTSTPSNTVTPTAPASTPGAPTAVTATAGNASATVNWTAPADGGSPITSYTVTPFAGAVAQPATTVTGSPPATAVTIGGLTNGTAYTFRVTATNNLGDGSQSAPSNAVTPTTPAVVPGAPSGVVASVGSVSGSVSVSWTAPTDGGSPITSYRVTPYIGTTAQAVTTVSGSPPAASATVSGLTNGTTYTFRVAAVNAVGAGPLSVASNQATPRASAPACPCGLFGATVPATADAGDGGAVQLGVKFSVDTPGFVNGVRFYKSVGNTGSHVVNLWSVSGQLLATTTATGETASGWQQANFTAPVAVSPGVTYVASYYAPNGHYAATGGGFNTAVNNPPVYAPATTTSANGVYVYNSPNTLPTGSYNASNYWVDPAFTTTAPPAGAVPGAPSGVVASVGAASGSVSVSWTAPADGGSPITSYRVTPYIGTTAQAVTTVSGSPPAASATVSGLTNGTTYTFRVAAVNAIGTGPQSAASNQATPQASAPTCPCTLFGATVPATPDAGDGGAVQLGVKFSVDTAGYINGVRFYKSAANTGSHVVNLWSPSGQRLATTTATGETASGWQQANFASPVAVSPGVTYVASYYAPNGHYAVAAGGFNTAVNNPPLFAPATTTSANGVYVYNSSSTLPTGSYNASNYFVDPVFDTSPPTGSVPGTPSGVVASVGAASGSVSVSWTAPADGGSPITSYRVTPYIGTTAQAVTTVSGSPPAASATVSGLTNGTTYTFRVAAVNAIGTGPQSAASNQATPQASAPTCPCTLFGATVPATPDAGDGGAVQLGVKFSVDTAGYINGVRFYKSAANTGSHVVNLWSPSGQRLATTTATGETASGWQQANFASPVAVSPGVTYVASYYTPNGHYAATGGAFNAAITNPPLFAPATTTSANGVYVYGSSSTVPTGTYNATNYWVDPVFTL